MILIRKHNYFTLHSAYWLLTIKEQDSPEISSWHQDILATPTFHFTLILLILSYSYNFLRSSSLGLFPLPHSLFKDHLNLQHISAEREKSCHSTSTSHYSSILSIKSPLSTFFIWAHALGIWPLSSSPSKFPFNSTQIFIFYKKELIF